MLRCVMCDMSNSGQVQLSNSLCLPTHMYSSTVTIHNHSNLNIRCIEVQYVHLRCTQYTVPYININISISILECTRAEALGNKPNEVLYML